MAMHKKSSHKYILKALPVSLASTIHPGHHASVQMCQAWGKDLDGLDISQTCTELRLSEPRRPHGGRYSLLAGGYVGMYVARGQHDSSLARARTLQGKASWSGGGGLMVLSLG
jgi:hypothetical protein